MSINKILQELDEQKVEEKPMIKEVKEDGVIQATIDLPTRKEIIRKYLEGKEKRDIGNEYGIPTTTVTSIVSKNQDLRLEIEKRYQATALARENYRLSESKNKLLSFVDNTLDEVANDPTSLTTEGKLKVLNSIAAVFDKFSITSRLNADKPTGISESRSMNVNVDKVLKELSTQEDKLNFLRGQNTSGNIVEVKPEPLDGEIEEMDEDEDDK